MAVEARKLNLFHPQLLNINRDLTMNSFEGFRNVYAAPIGYGLVAPPLSGTSTAAETVAPMYGSALPDTFPVKNASAINKSDSGVTYAAVPISRKRSRDAINHPLISSFQNQISTIINNNNNRCGSNLCFLGEDMSFHFQHQQFEVDRFIAEHTEKVRLEIEERRKRYCRRIAGAVEQNMMKKLRAKDEEIEKMVRMNRELEERVKSLCIDNQIWKDLAQTNKATANALRCNLEQQLLMLQAQQQAELDDAQSCCGSNVEEMNGHDREYKTSCRRCGEDEARVLLLPCRHLCLCTVCGSSINTCPVCKATKTASVHVNLS